MHVRFLLVNRSLVIGVQLFADCVDGDIELVGSRLCAHAELGRVIGATRPVRRLAGIRADLVQRDDDHVPQSARQFSYLMTVGAIGSENVPTSPRLRLIDWAEDVRWPGRRLEVL